MIPEDRVEATLRIRGDLRRVKMTEGEVKQAVRENMSPFFGLPVNSGVYIDVAVFVHNGHSFFSAAFSRLEVKGAFQCVEQPVFLQKSQTLPKRIFPGRDVFAVPMVKIG